MHKDKFERELDVNFYSSSVELIKNVKAGNEYNVFLLDMIMPNKNGMAVGREVRKLNRKAKIIYLTSTADYVFEAFSVSASAYLLKPLKIEELIDKINEVCKLIEKEQPVCEIIKTSKGDVKTQVNDIVYIKNVDRAPHYYLFDNNVIEGVVKHCRFKEMISVFLNEHSFSLCNVGIAVNLSQVESVKRDTLSIYLKNGQEIAASRTMFTDFKKSLEDYWKEN